MKASLPFKSNQKNNKNMLEICGGGGGGGGGEMYKKTMTFYLAEISNQLKICP